MVLRTVLETKVLDAEKTRVQALGERDALNSELVEVKTRLQSTIEKSAALAEQVSDDKDIMKTEMAKVTAELHTAIMPSIT